MLTSRGSPADVQPRSVPPLHLDRSSVPQIRQALANHDPARSANATGMITAKPVESITIPRALF
ncbi:hypothetical protein [Lentzea xinjiangensis]|uniref:hypothetical protein n=1 Tax=Lentzea xinjiangensis TaxID=402600 RepID=UPI001160A1FD|nr:hypothetical protein [Lentzea xinjiangensis]